MSIRQATNDRSQHLKSLVLLTILWLCVSICPPPAGALDLNCTIAETLETNSVLHRSEDVASTESNMFRLPISEPGVLELYISAGTETATARVWFLGTDCNTSQGEDVAWVRIRETPREIHLLIRQPGDYFAFVHSEDPNTDLTQYALHSSFAAQPSAPAEITTLVGNPPADCQASNLPTFSAQPLHDSREVVLRRDGFAKHHADKDVDPWDDDGVSGFTSLPGVLVIEASDVPLDASLHDGEGCTLGQRVSEGALDISGSIVAAPVHAGPKRLLLAPQSVFDVDYKVSLQHYGMCEDATDDHHDRPLCSTVISPGVEETGSVDTEHDEDHFTFTLPDQQTLLLDLFGEDSARGTLYDDGGQRLATWAAGRLVRTLGPGRFYVLVAGGHGWPEEYSLLMTSTP